MIVNRANIDALVTNLKTTFNKALSTAAPEWDKVAMKVTSTGKQNDYAWLAAIPRMREWIADGVQSGESVAMAAIPRMREWIGAKHIKNLEGLTYSIPNRSFETTIEVKKHDIEDDQIGIYATLAQAAGVSAAELPDDLVFELLNAAFTAKCFDGEAFFSAGHVVGKTTVSNLGTKKFDISTVAKAKACFGAARTALGTMKDEEGRPLNVRPNLLVVPPALGDDARLLMTTDRLEDGKPNPYKGTAIVLESPRLTSDTAWFLMDTSKAVRPIIFQERQAPVILQQNDQNSDAFFLNGMLRFGAEARGAVGFGFWQLAYGSNGTVA
jgi:phage major head subunit gpT-like protein